MIVDGGPERAKSAWLRIAGVLLAVTLAVNVVGILSILNAGRSALADATRDLELDTLARSRALEADLAACRADLLFLASTPSIGQLPQALEQPNLVRVRWSRLDAEGSLLLFLQSRPEVAGVVIRAADQTPLLNAGRKQGVPVMLPPRSPGESEGLGPPLLRGEWALSGGSGTLEAAVEPAALLSATLGGDSAASGFTILDEEGRILVGSAGGGSEQITVSAPVADRGWLQEVRWTLQRSADKQRLLSSVSRLATGYRLNVLFNLTVMSLALVLGGVGLRQARRSARLEEQARQQVQVRELERQLFHTERLSTVGRLAAGMAHEINNPLEGMLNYLKLMEEDLAAGRLAEAREGVSNLREGLNRAAGIARQVLQLSNPGNPPMSAVDLAAVLREAVEFVRANRQFRDIQFVLDLPETLPPVSGNRLLLGQLFLNLVLNACQAQPQGGTVEVAAVVGRQTVTARVGDRGPGVPEELRERIFEPFFSSRHSTGLGLGVCRRIAQQHGSELRLSDCPGGGAEFSIELRGV
ncbi:MAG: ATP-binding protein [Acidobacteriota bacterium]